MALQWLFKRFWKLFLKGLARYLNEEIDLEQLDVQFGSAQIKDISLNADYINQELENAPFILKNGAIQLIVVRFPYDLEVQRVSITVAPRPPEEVREGRSKQQEDFRSACASPGDEQQQSSVRYGPLAGNCTYLGVGDGVRRIAQIVRSLVLNLRVKVTDVTVNFEGANEEDGCVEIHLPDIDYGRRETEAAEKVISFEGVSVAIKSKEHKKIIKEKGLSGTVQVTLPSRDGDSAFSLRCGVNPVQLMVSIDEVQQILSLVSAYCKRQDRDQDESLYYSCYESSMQASAMRVKKPLDVTSSVPLIMDWFPQASEPEPSSVDEFFECLDAWSQTGSGLWSLTRSAFIGTSDDNDSVVSCSIKADFKSVSTTLLIDDKDGLEMLLGNVEVHSQISEAGCSTDVHIGELKVAHLAPSSAHRRYAAFIGRLAKPHFPVALGKQNAGDAVEILTLAPSQGEKCAEITIQSGRERDCPQTSVNAVLQSLVFWVDVRLMDKLNRSLSCLRLPRDESYSDHASARFKLNASVLRMRALISAAKESDEVELLLVDLEKSMELVYEKSSGGDHSETRSTLHANSSVLHFVRGSSCSEIIRLERDTSGKAKVELRWKDKHRQHVAVSRQAWDSILAQKHCGLEGKGSEFAATTALVSEAGSAVADSLLAISPTSVHVVIPNARIDLSRAGNFLVFQLLSLITGSKAETALPETDKKQTVISFTCRRLEADIGIAEDSEKSFEKYDQLKLQVASLKAVVALSLEGDPSASFLNVKHGEAEVVGIACKPARRTRLLSCNLTVIGRGDGGGPNALATGNAGLTLAWMSWPGKDKLADSILTATLRGCTLLAVGGRFDWILALTKAVDTCIAPFSGGGDDPGQKTQSYFLLDGQDIAVCYEPGKMEEESHTGGRVACVLAAAALRVSSKVAVQAQTSQYDIWIKDLALHLVHLGHRKAYVHHYSTMSMQQAGYVQLAKSPVLGVLVKVANETGFWEVECTKAHLIFDSCSDTASAFGSLISDLQQLFAPDIQQFIEMRIRNSKGKSPEVFDPCVPQDPDEASSSASKGLFEDIVEDAFRRKRSTDWFAATQKRTPEIQLPNSSGDAPSVIEDYYNTDHSASSSPVHETSSTRSSEHEHEAEGGWYSDDAPAIFETHIPVEKPASSRKVSRDSSYPKAVGRVNLVALNVRWRLLGGSDWGPQGRKTDACMEVCIDDMDLQYDGFGPTGLHASLLVVNIFDIRVYDFSVNAPWKLVVGYYAKKSRPRESTSKALSMRMESVRPNPSNFLEEYRLSLALHPVWLHFDQSHVDFLSQFFSPPPTATDLDPRVLDDNTLLPFFQRCEIRAVTVRIDYVPRHIDLGGLTRGNVLELINLVSWKGVELHLNPVYAKGIYGWTSLMGNLFDEWLEDISKHKLQHLHKVARGCGPIRPFCAVGAGAAKLVVIPAQQYKKDRSIFRGMRKGALAFLQSLSSEALGMGASLAGGAHHILVDTELALGLAPSERKQSRGKHQPSGTRDGLQQAYESMAQGLESCATSLLGNPVKVYQREGSAGLALASALKGSPAAVLAPATAAADALRQALLGVRNSLDPDRKREYDEKHRVQIL